MGQWPQFLDFAALLTNECGSEGVQTLTPDGASVICSDFVEFTCAPDALYIGAIESRGTSF